MLPERVSAVEGGDRLRNHLRLKTGLDFSVASLYATGSGGGRDVWRHHLDDLERSNQRHESDRTQLRYGPICVMTNQPKIEWVGGVSTLRIMRIFPAAASNQYGWDWRACRILDGRLLSSLQDGGRREWHYR